MQGTEVKVIPPGIELWRTGKGSKWVGREDRNCLTQGILSFKFS
jgi:hypothetical protein